MSNNQPGWEQNYFNNQPDIDEAVEAEPQVLELHNRIKSLIQTIGKRNNIEVTTKMSKSDMIDMLQRGISPDKAWYVHTETDPKTKKVVKQYVHIPEVIMEDNEAIALGTAAHEAGHLRVTRMNQVIPDTVWEEPGIAMTLHALEELPTDQSVRKYYSGAGKWVDELRQNQVIKGIKDWDKLEVKPQLPRIQQINNLLVFGEHDPRRDPYDQAVVAVYDKIHQAVREYEQTLPEDQATETEILEKAKERYKIAYKKIWPQIKDLVKEDLKAEENRQTLKKALGNQGQDSQGSFKDLPQELQKELQKIAEKIKQKVSQKLKEQQKQLQKEISEKEQAIEQSAQNPQNKERQKQALQKELERIKKDVRSLNNPEKNEGLSSETQEQLEQKEQEATADQAQDIKKQIEQTEKELEDLYNDKKSSSADKGKKNQELENKLKELKEDQKAVNDKKPENLSEKSQQELADKKDQAREDLKNELQKEEADLKKQLEDFNKSSAQLQQEKQKLDQQLGQNKNDQKQINQESLPQPEQASENMQKMLDQALSEINERDINQELIKELEETLEKKYPGIIEEIKKQAQKIFEQMEDEMVKEMSSQIEQDAPNHEKINKEKKKQEERDIQQKIKEDFNKQAETTKLKREDDRRKIEANLKILEQDKSVYDLYYEPLRQYDRQLYQILEEIFVPNVKSQIKLKSSGIKINLPAVFRWEASRGAMKGGAMKGGSAIDNRIFETVKNPEKKDYAFSILNDVSSSMSRNDGAVQDFKAKILLSEVLNRLGIKFEIYSFSTSKDGNRSLLVPKIKDINEKLSDKVRRRISGLLKTENGTPTAQAIKIASEDFKKIQVKEKFMLVLTDGSPDNNQTTIQQIKEVTKNTDIKLIGIGLGKNMKLVEKFFPISLPGVEFEKLVEVLGELLKDIILHPKKYSFNAEGIDKFFQEKWPRSTF